MVLQTRSDARHFLYDHAEVGPSLGMYGVASVVAPTQMTDVKHFGNENFGPNHFSGRAKIILPNRNGNDQQKEAGELFPALGDLAHASPVDWTDTWNNEPWELVYGGTGDERQVTWDQLNDICKRALRRVLFFYWGPKGPWRDSAGRDNSDFSYGVDDWLASAAGLTIQPSSDPAHNESGFSSMLLTTDVTSGLYAYHLRGVPVQPGDKLFLAMNAIIVSGGPVTFQVWDYTANTWVQLLTSVLTATGEGARLHFGPRHFGVGSGTFKVNVRIGVGASSIVAVDSMPGHDPDEAYWKTPAWLTQNWRLQGLLEADYGRAIGNDVYGLRSKQYTAWMPNLDYTPENLEEDANPNAIQVMGPRTRGLPDKELWYAGQRQESDRVAFEDDSEVIHLDEDLYKAALLAEAALALEARDRRGPGGKWLSLYSRSEQLLEAQRVVRKQPAMRPQARRVRTAL